MNEQTSSALGAIAEASSPAEINLACEQLGKSLGQPQFYYIHRKHFGRVGLLGHNCGSPTIAELLPVAADSGDPVAGRAQVAPIPFAWDASDYAQASAADRATYRSRAALGYRSGVCAGFGDSSGQSVTLVLASAAPSVNAENAVGLFGSVLLAANTLLYTIGRLDADTDHLIELTQRERECLIYVLAGASAKTTARALNIAPRSVYQYLERARQRLGTQSSFNAALAAAKLGLIDASEAQLIRVSAAPNVGNA